MALPSEAAEQRCNDLSDNCVCSEPLNTNSYTQVTSGYWAANDTSSKKCSIEGVAGAVVTDGSGFKYQAVSSGEAITRLPATHRNTWVLRTNDGGGGQFVGTKFPSSSPSARIAMRVYRYWSSNYSWTGQGGCLNSSKILQFGAPAPILDGPSANHQLYGWTPSTWNIPSGTDCCWFGPGPTNVQGTYNPSNFNGKWWRFEMIVRNALPTGGPTIIEIYRKNVTDNLPEEKVIDTSMVTAQPVGTNWSSALATSLKPKQRVDNLWVDWFRNGSCTGFAALTHVLAAAWSTDAGQRIGGAVEIEGGGGAAGGGTAQDTVPPAAPSGPVIR
jgi:hypothetical protein